MGEGGDGGQQQGGAKPIWTFPHYKVRLDWNSCADMSSCIILLKRTRRERFYRAAPTVQEWQRVRFCHQVRGFLRNLIVRKWQWDLTP